MVSAMPEVIHQRHELSAATVGRSMRDITDQIRSWLTEIAAQDGLLTIFLRHTSASLTIQENADPDVQRDLVAALDRLAPEDATYRHVSEGKDDMPAHIKTMLTSVSLSVPVFGGQMALGTWQGIFLIEHRAGRSNRKVALQFIGICA